LNDNQPPQDPHPAPQKPPRRKRYSGKNPRRFEDKYKELEPARYSADVDKVLASGKTPAGTHRPIMVAEILQVLAPSPGDTALDCTLGYGGHALAILNAIQPAGRLLAMDVDPIELPKTEARLRSLGHAENALTTRRSNYAGCAKFVAETAPNGVQIILADLGLSSMQIDNPARGFTFKAEGPLDLRMNPERAQPASALLANLAESALASLLLENADEPAAASLARHLCASRSTQPILTTTQLARAVRSHPGSDEDTVRRVFQALRIAVNDEFAALDSMLRQLPTCLAPGGRVAILTFHSGEDRRVKLAFKNGLHAGLYDAISPEPLRPTPAEVHANPRARSTKLRWARRTTATH